MRRPETTTRRVETWPLGVTPKTSEPGASGSLSASSITGDALATPGILPTLSTTDIGQEGGRRVLDAVLEDGEVRGAEADQLARRLVQPLAQREQPDHRRDAQRDPQRGEGRAAGTPPQVREEDRDHAGGSSASGRAKGVAGGRQCVGGHGERRDELVRGQLDRRRAREVARMRRGQERQADARAT